MRQEVNLLAPELLPVAERLPLRQAGLALAAFSTLLLGISAYDRYALERARSDLSLAKERAAVARAEVTRLSAVNDHRAERTALNSELERLLGQRELQAQTLGAMDRELDTIGRGSFSSYLAGIAEAHVPGLWITGLTVDFGTDTLLIRGAAQQPTHVPGFVTQLRATAAFVGTTVDGIQLKADGTGAIGFELRGAPG